MSLEARRLCFSYGERRVLDGLDISVARGEMVAILGPNGAGKSTLLKVLCGLYPPDAGSVLFDGRPLSAFSRRELAQKLCYVSQEINRDVSFSAREVVRMGRTPHLSFLGTMTKDDLRIVEEAMAKMEVGRLGDHLLGELSSGEFQRVLLAMALSQDTQYVFLDEPTAFLDLRYQMIILKLLRQMNQSEGKTIVAVTHDLNLAAMFFKRIVLLRSGRIPADGAPGEVLSRANIKAVFEVDAVVDRGPDGRGVRVTLER